MRIKDLDLKNMTKKELKKLINPILVDNDRLIRRTLQRKAKMDHEKEKYEEFLRKNVYAILENTNKTLDDKLQKFSIKTIDGKYKMQIVHKDFIRLNENAELAKKIVDEYIEKHLKRADEGDSGKMIGFLKGLFESKRKITLSAGLLQFINMKFNDSNLRRAQELLKAAIESDKSKIYVNIYKKTDDGWEIVDNAHKEDF